MITSTRLMIVLLVLPVTAWCAGPGSNLVLKMAWAQKYRNRISINAKVTVLKLSSKEQDADIHGGSRANQVGLPMVAEILNGTQASQQLARQQLNPATGGAEKSIYGAWRLWFEHPPHGGGTQCQTFSGQAPAICEDQDVTSGSASNPDHSFEIHPVFAVNGQSVAKKSMVLLADNKSVKDSQDSFDAYKAKTLNIARTPTGLTLSSTMIGFNYVRMRLQVVKTKTPTKRDDDDSVDGGFVRADVVTNDDDKVLASNVRVFYLLDSEPGQALQSAHEGDELEILAMPRVDLDAVLTVSQGKEVTSVQLPVEFVAVALTAH